MHARVSRRSLLLASAALLPLHRARAAGPPRQVVVVGAGLAGLVCAYELVAAGFEVTVLEGQPRPGGRVRTLRGLFADGLYAEAGAANVSDAHTTTVHYANALGVALDPVERTGGVVYHLRGQRLVEKPGAAVAWPVRLSGSEAGLSRGELYARYFGDFLKGIDQRSLDDPAAPEHLALDRVSVRDWLKQRGASDEAIALIRLGLLDLAGRGIEETSALYVIRDMVHRLPAKQSYVIRGGSDRLPYAFAEKLEDRIRYGIKVVAFEQSPTHVTVRWEGGGALKAERVVCAIPFSRVRLLKVSPAFSPGKRQAIEGLRHSTVVRVYAQSRRRFWRDEGLNGYGFTDLPIRGVLERTGSQPGTRGLLEAYVVGAEGKRLGALSAPARESSALAQMKQLHPQLGELAEGTASVVWEHDEWARGAYPWFAPGEMAKFGPHLARAEGRVHFAGDQTSSWPGWMQGALDSGVRAAREIVAAEQG